MKLKNQIVSVLDQLANGDITRNVPVPTLRSYLGNVTEDEFYNALQNLMSSGLLIDRGNGNVAISIDGQSRIWEQRATGNNSQSIHISESRGPIQIGGAQSTQTLNVNQEFSEIDLRRIVNIFEKNIEQLELDDQSRRQAVAQINTISAQLESEPNKTIVLEALKSLRRITEGAITGLITKGLTSFDWSWILSILPK